MGLMWILIANSSTARIYFTHRARLYSSHSDRESKNTLVLIDQFEHTESRKKSAELVSDRIGNYHFGKAGHGSFVETTDPKEWEAECFARELADILETGRVSGEYDELVIVATPHFQGLMNKALDSSTAKLVHCTVKQDYTHYSSRMLASQLAQKI